MFLWLVTTFETRLVILVQGCILESLQLETKLSFEFLGVSTNQALNFCCKSKVQIRSRISGCNVGLRVELLGLEPMK